jgi:uncharacterized protein
LEAVTKPEDASVWVLLGPRTGDNAQALELARRVGGQVTEKRLQFNQLATIPNWLAGKGFASVQTEFRNFLQPPWPDLVIATGRKTARVSLAIKAASNGRTKTVHIGRPRLNLNDFDLILTTPQYGLPGAANVVELPTPFAVAKTPDASRLKIFENTWRDLPRPWIVGVIGAAKFPVRMGNESLREFAGGLNRLAGRLGGAVIVIDSPRSTAGSLQHVVENLSVKHWAWQRDAGENPYQAALALGDQFGVTSDSVSMVSEMVATGKPTHVFHLPVSRLVPEWSAKSGLAAALARTGVLSPPRAVANFMAGLDSHGWIGDLKTGRAPRTQADVESAHAEAVKLVRALISG